MKFGYTIFYVENVENTLEFYEKAFGLKKLFLHDSGEYGELDTGETKLAFASHKLAELNDIGFSVNNEVSSMEIGFVTEDVESAFNHAVAAGAQEVHKPAQKPWGQTVSYVRDINGFLVEICTPI